MFTTAEFNIANDGKTLVTAQLQELIDRCGQNGGGKSGLPHRADPLTAVKLCRVEDGGVLGAVPPVHIGEGVDTKVEEGGSAAAVPL